jgi:hypothetical protein
LEKKKNEWESERNDLYEKLKFIEGKYNNLIEYEREKVLSQKK